MTITTVPPPTPTGIRHPALVFPGLLDRPRPAPLFDDLHPFASMLPLAGCVEDPIYRQLVGELGDPSRAALDARVVAPVAGRGLVVSGVVVDEPATLPLPLGGRP
jgi:hypothetical protein